MYPSDRYILKKQNLHPFPAPPRLTEHSSLYFFLSLVVGLRDSIDSVIYRDSKLLY